MTSTPAAAKKERDYLFDNIKALLIFLVAAVHFMAAVTMKKEMVPLAELFKVTACIFHMPMFFFISGYFSKNLEKSEKGSAKILRLYLIAQLINIVYHLIAAKNYIPTLMDIIVPSFSMWYLFALFFMRSYLPQLVKIKYILPASAVLSVLIMASGNVKGLELVVMRGLANLVYFIMGYCVTSDMIAKVRKLPKIVYGGLLALSLGIAYVVIIYLDKAGLSPYKLRNMLLRNGFWPEKSPLLYPFFTAAIIAAVYFAVLIIGVMPSRKTIISSIGRNSVYVYIAQAVIYQEFNRQVKAGFVTGSQKKLFAAAMVLALACTLIFGNSFTASIPSRIKGLISRPKQEQT
ncbi:MAG: acyltransferase family protein [Ruminococcus sp.]|nr:acyltransferase family protein [Ruminococcus sp.]